MIKLSQIKDALYEVDMESTCYFNTKTNEIIWQWDFNKENSVYTDLDEFNEDIIDMFSYDTKNNYDIMQEFIFTINNDKVREQLFNNTRGKGSFRRFREITDYNNITDDWYKFQDNKYKEIAEEWCINNEIEFERDC